jgi:hypothetical protein
MSRIISTSTFAGFITTLCLGPPVFADGKEGFILQAGTYFDIGEPFIGAGYQFPLNPRLSFVPNAEYVFVNNGDLYTVNLDSRYALNPAASNPMWVGAGIGMIRREAGPFNDTDSALNLMWGINFDSYTGNLGNFTPFISTRAILSDDSEVGLSFGIRFGGSQQTGSTPSD